MVKKVVLLVLVIAVVAYGAPPTEEMPSKEEMPAKEEMPVKEEMPEASAPPAAVTTPAKTEPLPAEVATPAESPAPPADVAKPAEAPAPPAETPEPTEAPARAEEPTPKPKLNGTCQCAAFKTQSNADEEMIGSKTMSFTVDCNDKGRKECRDMCVALAQANKLKAPAKTCEEVPDVADGIKPAVYYKACNAGEWLYSGTKAKELICCKEGKPTPCQPKKENTY